MVGKNRWDIGKYLVVRRATTAQTRQGQTTRGGDHGSRHRLRESGLGDSRALCGPLEGINGEAEIIFTIRGPALISADHTHAPESMRPTGAAAALVEHMISDARADGIKIMPMCPCVQA